MVGGNINIPDLDIVRVYLMRLPHHRLGEEEGGQLVDHAGHLVASLSPRGSCSSQDALTPLLLGIRVNNHVNYNQEAAAGD